MQSVTGDFHCENCGAALARGREGWEVCYRNQDIRQQQEAKSAPHQEDSEQLVK